MSLFDIAAVLIVAAAISGYINHLFFRLPPAIGLVLMALLASIAVMLIDLALPSLGLVPQLKGFIAQIDFYETLMHGMLGFILFAGALHINFSDLADQKWMVILTATIGLIISTLIIGAGFWYLTGVPFIVALVFGALISPTDPVAVLGMLKTVRVPKSLQTKIAGESLFNDGIAVVIFLILTALAFSGGHGDEAHGTGPADVVRLFFQEAVGGAVLGSIAGWLVCKLMARVDEFVLEVTITLALVMGVYSLAFALHMSGPIAVVVAGLFVGNAGFNHGMSSTTREHVQNFWHLIDEMLNAALFLLIGIEILAIPFDLSVMPAVLACIPLTIAARTMAILIPMFLLRHAHTFSTGAAPILIWGGLRGGISVALALSLPDSAYKDLILSATYLVVIFSIVVQGLSMPPLIRSFGPKAAQSEPGRLTEGRSES